MFNNFYNICADIRAVRYASYYCHLEVGQVSCF